ncbi:MAG: uroporphyrinogen-III C-methyltransferase [Chloroflexi bacterium]|nr:uroporphyrinogen-III C-methyltransferase [Chloroflexota bacterium]
MAGIVYLVGAGPGDPGLITVKGMRQVESADCIVYDRLTSSALLEAARDDAELIDVGKIPGKSDNRQEDINDLLVRLGKEGKRVVRLKGGDPFVFGRGGEEAEALRDAGIAFEVVPGITSAIAAPAYAGIPLTHRRFASHFTVVTGNEDPTKPDSAIDWSALARQQGTLVVLMGRENLAGITETLVKNGRSPDTPVALVQWGTEPFQQTLTGTLADIADRAENADLKPPVVTVIGDVVNLREKLAWFDNRPLFGRRVLVTRTRTQASGLSQLLLERGAMPVELPTIEIRRPDVADGLDAPLKRLEDIDWVVFTSVNAVDFVFERLDALGLDARAFSGCKVAVIGPATAEKLKNRGIVPDLVPESFVSESLVEALKARNMQGSKVLLPRADIARDALSEGLRALGACVDEVTAYQTVTPADTARIARDIVSKGVDVATFTSSSTVRNLSRAMNGELEMLSQATIACIGPITADAAREVGLAPDIVSNEHTIPGLVDALEAYFMHKGGVA